MRSRANSGPYFHLARFPRFTCKQEEKRRGWDSNPRDGLTPPTRFPVALLRPTRTPLLTFESLADGDRKNPPPERRFAPRLPFGASSEKPDSRDNPSTRAIICLYVLFFVLIAVVIVEEPGPEEEVGEGTVS